jgi:hypothetical protein
MYMSTIRDTLDLICVLTVDAADIVVCTTHPSDP